MCGGDPRGPSGKGGNSQGTYAKISHSARDLPGPGGDQNPADHHPHPSLDVTHFPAIEYEPLGLFH